MVDKYEVIQKIGEGGMATVYRGRHLTLGREVAIKVLHPHLSASERNRLRFAREARAIEHLEHDNILKIFDYSGSDTDACYIVTEFVDGDGPVVGEGFILRIFFQNLAGKELGTLYALSKRNIEANAPDKDDLEYYLFVDLTKEWTVNGSSRAPPPAAVNIGPALWTADLHEAMEFAAFRSIDLVAGQFTR